MTTTTDDLRKWNRTINSLNGENIPMTGRRINFGLLLVMFVSVGCGQSAPKMNLVPVSGTVKLGGEPAKGIRIAFVPIPPTPGIGAVVLADDDGTYKAVYDNGVSKKDGLPPGKYSVLLANPFNDEGPAAATKRMLAGDGLPIPESWKLPNRVGDHNKVTVSEEGGTIDFDVPLAGKESKSGSQAPMGPRGKMGLL